MVRSFGDCFCKYLLGVFAMILFKYVQIISVFHLDRQYKFSKQDEHLNRGGSPSNNGWRLSIVFGCASALASLAPQDLGIGGGIGFEVFLVWKCGMNLASGWWFHDKFLRFHYILEMGG